ncbi:MAG: PQQ-dependent sugar dehydrogenase [Acidimicrobiia bacterium]|nr:PQQ-dependent sugar dehydrogenase [Acidimicrobiia bacterium]
MRCRTVGVLLVLLAVGAAACTAPASAPGSPPEPSTTTSLDPIAPTSPPETTGPGSSTSTTVASGVTSNDPLPLTDVRLALNEVASGLGFPVLVTAPPGDGRIFVVLKEGRVLVGSAGGGGFTPFLDIADRVRDSGEQGLLGMAFHPSFPSDDRLFVHYSARDGSTVLSAFAADPLAGADPRSESVIFTTPQPAANHNGGMVQFGPDGFLYLALGDGGGANDRYRNGQDVTTPLGAMLRLDVDGPLLFPEESVFDGGLPELWAIGLRNPWRFWIDAPTRQLYIGDVGQGTYEEVDVAPLEPGQNFGWPIVEGLHCFSGACNPEGLVPPVLEVSHRDSSTCSITGGVVYRGPGIPGLTGAYLYSDYCGGYLRGIRVVDGQVVESFDWTAEVGGPIGQVTSFGVDGLGEIYVMTADGRVLALEEAP